MGIFYFDYETNGFLNRPDLTAHCMAWAVDEGPVNLAVGEEDIRNVLEQELPKHSRVCAHYLTGFDGPVTAKLFGIDLSTTHEYVDTKVIGSLVDPEFSGTHSLAEWGRRVNAPKDDYQARCKEAGIDPWAKYSEEMGEYCKQDVSTLRKVHRYQQSRYLDKHDWTLSLALEHRISAVMAWQEFNGVWFDYHAAEALQDRMEREIREHTDFCSPLIKPKCIEGTAVAAVFKKDGAPSANAWKALGMDPDNPVEGLIQGPFTRVSFSEYDLNSRQQVVKLLQLHGWKPTEYTEKGNPKFTEESITASVGPVGKALAERFVTISRLSTVRNWMAKVRSDGRISAKAFAQATPTGRMRHSIVVNVPRPGTKWGPELRSLFGVEPVEGRVLVGVDASQLELRMLAHYMNDPAYTKKLLESDIHWYNVQLMGLVPMDVDRVQDHSPTGLLHEEYRNVAKTFIYGLIYGAGDEKIGSIVAHLEGWSGTSADGKLLRGRFFKGLPKLAKLLERISEASKKKWLLGMDGRRLYIRHDHAGLNLLMQAGGSIVVKAATVYAYTYLKKRNIPFKQVLHMHDEVQYETTTSYAQIVGSAFVNGLRWAGKKYGVNCPLDGDIKVGTTWSDTH